MNPNQKINEEEKGKKKRGRVKPKFAPNGTLESEFHSISFTRKTHRLWENRSGLLTINEEVWKVRVLGSCS